MGCAQSVEDPEAEKRSQAIDRELKKAGAASKTELKMLLLGAGESGKSTVVKQLRLNFAEPYSMEERLAYREVVYVNVVQSMQAVINGFDALSVEIPPGLQAHADFLVNLDNQILELVGAQLDSRVTRAIVDLWDAPTTKEVVSQSHKFQLNDSAAYYFDRMHTIGAPKYVPDTMDILRTRVRSTGIVEALFQVRRHTLRVLDVGGQRSERRKWIHCFANVDLLLFVAAISEYDQTLWEDEEANRLDEALVLFDSIASSRWFTESALILFLNKVDLFRDKLTTSPLSNLYPDYTGGDNYNAACAFMQEKFQALNRQTRSKGFYIHFTCSVDSSQVHVVINTMMDTILHRLLADIGVI